MLRKIHHNRDATWHFQRLMGVPLTPYHKWAENRCGNKQCRYQVLLIWRRHHRHAHHRYKRVGSAPSYYDARYAGLRCIHGGEGSWDAYNPAGYYGGLQMDWSFMRHWGADMLARHGGKDARYWTPLEQLIVGYRAVQHIGYSPWPNTRIPCGV